jgi:hypothetical protein
MATPYFFNKEINKKNTVIFFTKLNMSFDSQCYTQKEVKTIPLRSSNSKLSISNIIPGIKKKYSELAIITPHNLLHICSYGTDNSATPLL